MQACSGSFPGRDLHAVWKGAYPHISVTFSCFLPSSCLSDMIFLFALVLCSPMKRLSSRKVAR